MKKLRLIIVSIGIGLHGFAQDSLNLDEAISIALEQNLGILMSVNTNQIAIQQRKASRANLLPKVNSTAGGSYSNNDTRLEFAGGNPPIDQKGAQSTNVNASVGLNYTLFNGGIFKNYQKLQENASLSDYEYKLKVEQTIMQVVASYLEYARAIENERIAKEALQISRDRYNRLNDQKKLGIATNLELLNAQVDLNADSINWVSMVQTKNIQVYNLNVLLGENSKTDRIITPIENLPDSMNLQLIENQVDSNNTQLWIARKRQSIATINTKIAKLGLLPKLDVNASYGYSRSDNEASFVIVNQSNGLNAGVTLTIPIFNGLSQTVNYQSAKLTEYNTELALEEAKLNIHKDFNIASENYQKNKMIYGLSSTSISMAKDNLNRTQELYRQGQITSIQFREAQLNYLKVKFNESNAKYNLQQASYELLRISGQLLQ